MSYCVHRADQPEWDSLSHHDEPGRRACLDAAGSREAVCDDGEAELPGETAKKPGYRPKAQRGTDGSARRFEQLRAHRDLSRDDELLLTGKHGAAHLVNGVDSARDEESGYKPS